MRLWGWRRVCMQLVCMHFRAASSPSAQWTPSLRSPLPTVNAPVLRRWTPSIQWRNRRLDGRRAGMQSACMPFDLAPDPRAQRPPAPPSQQQMAGDLTPCRWNILRGLPLHARGPCLGPLLLIIPLGGLCVPPVLGQTFPLGDRRHPPLPALDSTAAQVLLPARPFGMNCCSCRSALGSWR